eukprot:gene17539-23101_t
MIPFVIPRLDVSIVLDIPEFPRNRIPTEMRKLMNVSSTGLIYPKIYLNEFWITSNQLIEINSTIDSISLTSTYSHIAFWKWQFQVSMEEQWKNQRANGLGGSDRETDTLREILLETNPYLLGVTAVVTLLHSLFDILAFKNDIQFWRNKKDLKGLSIRSLACFRDDIIFFIYLYQRWIYRVDYSRTNEYGQGGDENSTIPVIEDNNEHEKLQ